MKDKKWVTKEIDNLFSAILSLKDTTEARMFFRDLLTEDEIKEFADRWQVAQMLENKISYSKIEKETGMSSTTIARISKWLQNGCDGYKLILNRIHHSNPVPLRRGLT